ncbi:hypothetical protein BDV12DRAFT_116301 [Aspergillus spectabilis]
MRLGAPNMSHTTMTRVPSISGPHGGLSVRIFAYPCSFSCPSPRTRPRSVCHDPYEQISRNSGVSSSSTYLDFPL